MRKLRQLERNPGEIELFTRTFCLLIIIIEKLGETSFNKTWKHDAPWKYDGRNWCFTSG